MQKNISEENANNQKIIYSQNDESKATDGSSTEESTSLQEVSKQIEKLFKLNTELKGQILDLTKTNSNLQNRMNIVEKKIKGLEALVIHNNINMDFISNRDSLKTLLLIVGVNLKVVSEPEIKSICQNFVSKVKFTKLILKILDNLSMKLNPKELPWRRGMEKEKNDQVLSEEEKKKIIHNIIFFECIHFIVCCIDNIVHPPDKIDNNENGNIYSKLMGKRSQDNLEKGLLQFFRNPNILSYNSPLGSVRITFSSAFASTRINGRRQQTDFFMPLLWYSSYIRFQFSCLTTCFTSAILSILINSISGI